MNKTKIEWCELSWNPITGCDKISAGCEHCYAERMARRLHAMKNPRYQNGFNVTIHRDLFNKPLTIKVPHMIFVNSMSDLFHNIIPDDDIIEIFKVMNQAHWHTFQILTKRPERLVRMNNENLLTWTPNIWMGVTVENQQSIERIDLLRNVNADVKFLSCEPLLEDLGHINLNNIDWVIVGGESGPDSRVMEEGWVQNILTECENQDVPFFFKQWGGKNKKKSGRLLNNRVYNEYPRKK